MTATHLDLPGPIRLPLVTAEPATPPRPLIIVIAPGRTEFCEKYEEVLAHLTSLGYRALVFDWRGQGHATRLLRDPMKGHVARFDDYLADLDAVLTHAETFAAPIALLAHSMGGHIALRALARWPGRVRGAVLSAPMVAIRATSRLRPLAELMAGAGFAHAYVWGRRAYGPADRHFPGNLLTHDETRFLRTAGAIAADPALALGGPTWGWLRAALRSTAALRGEAAAGRIADPVLLVAAGGDRVVDNDAQRALASHLPQARLLTVDGAAHELMMESDPYRLAFWREAEPFLERLASP